MKSFRLALCLVVLCCVVLFDPDTLTARQGDRLSGTYTLDESASDNINNVIDDAVSKLNFLIKPLARERLTKLNPAYRLVTIAFTLNELSVTVDRQPALKAPANGTTVVWEGPDRGKVNVSMQLKHGHLVQTFKSADGGRINYYTLSPDGRVLTMQVTETSPRLTQAIQYKQVYKRVS